MAAVFAAVVNGDTGTTGTKDYTKTGFGTPKAAIVLCARAETYDTAISNGALSIGFWDSTTQVCYSCFAEGSGAAGDTTDFGYNNKIMAIDNIDSSLQFSATVENITDGIRLTFSGDRSAAYKVTVVLFNGADLQAKAGALALGTGTSPIEVSCGFQPDLILATCARSNDGTHGSFYLYPSFGCAKDAGGGSTTHRCNMMFQDAATTMNNATVVRTDCLIDKTTTGGRSFYITASGWDANGLDVTPSASTSSAFMMYLALDVGSASTWLGTVNPPTTASGAWDSPNTGFTPQLVILGQMLCDAVDSSDTASPQADIFGICAFDDTTEGSIAITEDDGHTDAAAKSYASERLAYLYDGTYTAPTLYYDIGNATMDSTGWTVADDEVDTADATTRYWWGLAIEQGTTSASCSIAQTLPKLSQAVTSDVDVSSTAAQSLPKLSQSAAADVDVSCSATQTLPKLQQSASIDVDVSCSASQTLPKLSQTVTTDVDVSCSSTQTLPKLAQIASVSSGAVLSGSQTLPKLSQTAAADVDVITSAAQTLLKLAQAGTVLSPGGIIGAQTLPKLSQSATADVDTSAAAAQTLPRLSQAITAAVQVAAEINQSLPKLVQSANSWGEEIPIDSQIVQTLPRIRQGAALGDIRYNVKRVFQVSPRGMATFYVPARISTFTVTKDNRLFHAN